MSAKNSRKIQPRKSGGDQPLRVSIDDAHMDRVPEVVDRLEACGMSVTKVMTTLGTVTGSAEASDVPAIRTVVGIADVEHAQQVGIPPPTSEVQ